MSRPTAPPPNLFELVPRPRFGWEAGAGGRAVILIPKFRRGPLARWLQRRLRKPNVRVTLDELGSFVWERCDGTRTVLAIAEEARARYGDAEAGLQDRVAAFVQTLARQRLVTLLPKEGA